MPEVILRLFIPVTGDQIDVNEPLANGEIGDDYDLCCCLRNAEF